jgi:WD40 repeat protein
MHTWSRLRRRLPQLLLLLALILTLPIQPVFAQTDADADGIDDTLDNCPANAANNSNFPTDSTYYGCPDSDADRIPDVADQCPTEPVDPTASNTGAPLGCPITAGPVQAVTQQATATVDPNNPQCLIAFDDEATYSQPSTSAPVLNDNPNAGIYVATQRTADNVWWLLNNTDWVQGTPMSVTPGCSTLPLYTAPVTPTTTPAAAECSVAFSGSATYAQPSVNATVINDNPTAGTYAATQRTADNRWWLLNGTDWVQATPVNTTPGCATLPVFTPPIQLTATVTGGATCQVAFSGRATYAQPSVNARVINDNPVAGTYTASQRTADNQWWLLNGTDWVQATPVAGSACNALAVYNPNAQPSAGCETHTVAPGETLFRIARQYGLSANALASYNNITNPNSITVGQRLNIPCPESENATPEATLDPSVDFTLPANAITPVNAATVTQLFERTMDGVPGQLAFFSFGQIDDSVAVVNDEGLLTLYSILAPDTMPGSETGDYQKIYRLTASSNGALATAERNANDDGSIIRVWGQTTGGLDETFDILPNPLTDTNILSMALSNALLVTSADYPTSTAASTPNYGVRLWTLTATGGTEATFIPLTEPAFAILFNAEGTRFATATSDGTVQVWDTAATAAAGGAPTPLARFNDGAGSVNRLAGSSALDFSPDGNLIAVGGSDGQVRVWDITGNKLATALPYQSPNPIFSVAFSPDGSVIATAGGLPPTNPGSELAGTPLPPVQQDNTVYLWDVAEAVAQRPSQLATLTGHSNTVFDLAFNTSGTILTSISADSTWRLWGVPQAS